MNNEIEQYRLMETIRTYFNPNPDPANNFEKFVDWIKGTRPANLGDILQEMHDLKLMVCGGAVNSIFSGTIVNDLDFYMKDIRKLTECKAFLMKWFPENVFVSNNALTYKRKSTKSRKVWTAQLITRFSGTPQEIFKNFDFTITTGAFDFETGEFVFGDRFFQDLSAKKLVYQGASHYPICALYRTKKYQERGYKVPGSTLMHIALSIVRLEIKNYRELKEQLSGVDTCYLQGLLDSYSEKGMDELPVDYGQFLVDAFQKFDGVEHNADDFESGDFSATA